MAKLKILLVTDCPASRLCNGVVLKRLFNVTAVRNGLEAWKHLASSDSQVNMVLITYDCANISDGIELTKKIKDSPQTRHLPVALILKAYHKFEDKDAENLSSYVAAGMSKFMEKPIENNDLEAIKDWITKYSG